MKQRVLNVLAIVAVAMTAMVSCGPKDEVDLSIYESQTANTTHQVYNYAPDAPVSAFYSVKVAGDDCYVYPVNTNHDKPQLVSFGTNGLVRVEVTPLTVSPKSVVVRPLAKNYPHKIEGGKIILYLTEGDHATIEVNGDEDAPIFLFANPLEINKPDRNDPNVEYYEAGKIYDKQPKFSIASGKTIYIEGGAIVKGAFDVKGVNNITLAGYGIIDDFYVKKENQSLWSFKVWECNNVKVDGLTVCNMYGWSCAFLEVNDLDINNFKVIAPYNEFNDVGVDNGGIDLLGCQRAKCVNSFAYAHDDGILVKAHKWSYAAHAQDNLFENCISWTVGGGNSFEVGYELDKGVEDVTFRNIYALHSGTRANAYRRGAVTIHNATAGVVQNINYENVHIEDPKEYGIYVSLLRSEYGIGDGVEWGPGVIKNVTFKNVYFYKEPPRGHQINGLNNGDSRVQNLVFENLNICGKKITQPDERFFIQLADVKFK